VPEYCTWEQVAGYFDGDGTIYFSDTTNQPYKLRISLVFVDQSIDQLTNIWNFLNQRGIRTSRILRRSDTFAYELAVSEFQSVRQALIQMLPSLCKKSIEAKAALDYYEGKITGNELHAVFQSEVEAGRRERKRRTVRIDVPYTLPMGDKLMKERRSDKLRDAFGRFRAIVTPEDYEKIRFEHYHDRKRLFELVKEYPQYARETIRRVLGGGRGYVGVKGVGRVDTTDNR
jgi:hypothetical protein